MNIIKRKHITLRTENLLAVCFLSYFIYGVILVGATLYNLKIDNGVSVFGILIFLTENNVTGRVNICDIMIKTKLYKC